MEGWFLTGWEIPAYAIQVCILETYFEQLANLYFLAVQKKCFNQTYKVTTSRGSKIEAFQCVDIVLIADLAVQLRGLTFQKGKCPRQHHL